MAELVKINEDEIIRTATSSSTYQHYFYMIRGDKVAHCKICLQTFKYDVQNTVTSRLNRHLEAKHPKVAEIKTGLKDSKKEESKSI